MNARRSCFVTIDFVPQAGRGVGNKRGMSLTLINKCGSTPLPAANVPCIGVAGE